MNTISFQSTKTPQPKQDWGVLSYSKIGLFVAIMAVGGNDLNNHLIINDVVYHPMFLGYPSRPYATRDTG